jgi:16S rRNA (adenine1518-N6/adenine1519-N6)-dimethyltransferase
MAQPLGQHFLKNLSAIERIVDELNISKGEAVIEIGPGRGALTLPLARRCEQVGAKLIAIEKDPELADNLKLLAFSGKKNTEIIYGDVLRELPAIVSRYQPVPTGRQVKASSYKLVGNIPYYITGAILRTISELAEKPTSTVLMVQKEVAERVCAKEGEMNLLSAATQVWSDTEVLFTLSPKEFDPPPKVWSAVMRLDTKKSQLTPEELEKYYRTIKILFKQPRKTLLNNLVEGGVDKEEAKKVLAALKLSPSARAQDLSTENILSLNF